MVLGAYGLQILGAGEAGELLLEVPGDWPPLEIVRRAGRVGLERGQIREDRAEIPLLGDGAIELERHPLRAIFTTPERLEDEALIHPYLAPAASVAARWLGREGFHAGAFVLDGGVWGVLGDRESGKSSTLAWLALQGHDVFCDDALIVDKAQAYAGPRSIDLRAETADHLASGEGLGMVGERERWRIRLAKVPSAAPLRGWVFLEWSDTLELVRTPSSEAIARLFEHRTVRLPPIEPARILDLLTLPAWTLRRPRRWQYLDEASRRLVEIAS